MGQFSVGVDTTKANSITPAQLVARFRDKPLDFPPGTRWKYSNSGYALLGYLIEKSSGRTYGQFVHENLFVPLKMNDSGYAPSAQIPQGHAVGYTPGPRGPVVAPFIDMSVPFSAGALYSTADDMLRWERALFGGALLSTDSLSKMTKPYLNGYGLGVGVRFAPNGDQMISHGGGIEGFNTSVTYVPAQKLTVIVLANLNGRAAGEIAGDLIQIARHEATRLDEDQLKSEAALRRSLSGIALGRPEYDQMAPEFAAAIRASLSALQSTLATWGKILSMSFVGVGTGGEHLYDVTFESVKLRASIVLGPDGKVVTHGFAPLP